jgi:DNA polymerase I
MNANPKNTLLLIDGHSLAFRAFYALSPDAFRAPNGQHTNAVHGFISMMLNILGNEKPTHLAVAFDLSRSSFRTDEYPEYKGTRGETPPEFNGQTEALTEALAAMNITTLTKVNYEADDIIASLADQAADKGFEVLIVSGDRDTFQLIRPETTILYPVKGVMNLARMDDDAVVAKYGIHAKQYPDLAALVGESSDNLPGIPGVGPKTAAKWINEFGSLDAILSSAESIGGKVGESLREHRELAVRNRRLNHLVRDLELVEDFEAFRLKGVDEVKVKEVFTKLAFRTLTERVLKLRGIAKGAEAVSGSTDEPEVVIEQIEIPEVQKLESVGSWLAKHELVAVSVSHNGSFSFGLASATERVETRDEAVLEWLKSASKKAVYNAKAIDRLLLEHGLKLGGVELDALLLCYLNDPVRRDYSLDNIALDYLGLSVERAEDDGSLLSEAGEDLSLDAFLVFKTATALAAKVEAQEQLKVYRDVELPSSATLAQMEHYGIAVDKPKLEKLFEKLGAEVKQIETEAFAIIGHEINLSSPKQLQTVLFEELGMTGTKQVKTGFSTNAEALTTLFEQNQHPFLEKLLNHREVTKIRQMVEVVLKSIGKDGRIHTNYVQTGTSTGRLSSEGPNLQNIPIKSERGREIRDAFIVGDGFETLLSADYSQIEMRIMAHLSEDEGLIEAFKSGEDLHRFVGSRIFGVTPDAVTSAMRSKVKAMSYGLVYGLSEYGLAKQLRMSNAEAKQLMNDYFARFGGVRRYLATVVEDAKLNGYTVTTFGRRRPFDDLKSPIFQIRENARRAALNAPIQGTAADIMKLAMNRIGEEISSKGLKSRMLLQVHDELVFEVAPGELETLRALVVNQMANVVELRVPLEVHVGIGKTWDAADH